MKIVSIYPRGGVGVSTDSKLLRGTDKLTSTLFLQPFTTISCRYEYCFNHEEKRKTYFIQTIANLACPLGFHRSNLAQSVESFGFIFTFKVAPYSFMTTRALMMRASVICACSNENVGFS